MLIDLRKSGKYESGEVEVGRGRSLKKCILNLNMLSPKSKAELDYRTINCSTGKNEDGTSLDQQYRTAHFKLERCPSERQVCSSRKKHTTKRYYTPNAESREKYATIFEKFQS